MIGHNRVLKSRVRDRVIVTLKDGSGFRGVLWDADRTSIVLRRTEALGIGAQGADVAVDGELLILLADVAYINRL